MKVVRCDDGESHVVIRKLCLAFLAVVLIAALATAIATAGGSIDLRDAGDLHEAMGQSPTQSLLDGVTYSASAFAVSVKIDPPGPLWTGAQYESQSYRWILLNHQHVPGTSPLTGFGYITLESATVATPSAAKTLAKLRATPHMRAGPTRTVAVAGARGKMFDATITGVDTGGWCASNRCDGISFAPFRENRHCSFCTHTLNGKTRDTKYAKKGQLLRIIVINTHGKIVVIYIESIFPDQKQFPPAKLFPTFLPYAQKMLASISFS